MIYPDEIPAWIGLPLALVLCIIWRRQVVVERRSRR